MGLFLGLDPGQSKRRPIFIIYCSGDNYEREVEKRLEASQPKEVLFFSWTPHILTVCDPLQPNATFYRRRQPTGEANSS